MPASLVNTNLAVAISNASDRVLSVISATGFVVGYGLYIDREYMIITGISSTNISVVRGAGGTRATPHLVGTQLYVAPKNYFTTYDRQGAGVDSEQLVSPYINITNGNIWSVIGGRWVVGNTYAATTNYGLSPAIWSDCPLSQMANDPAYGSVIGDDFLSGVTTTAHMYSLIGTNGLFAQVAGAPHGTAILTAQATDEDEATLTAPGIIGLIKADALSTWWFETRLKMSRTSTDQAAFVGLAGEGASELDAAFLVDASGALKVVDSIGFRIIAPTATVPVWDTVMQLAGGSLAILQASVLTSVNTYIKLGMKCVAGKVTFYVNGTPQTTTVLSSAANFPLDQVMSACWATKSLVATATSMTLDWWKAAQTRIAN
jgi:hypothetical protein